MAEYKRPIAYKLKIGDLIRGSPIIENEKLIFIELGDKKIIKANIIGSVIEKFTSEGEKKFATVTIDDASGQIKLRVFGDNIQKISSITEGQTIVAIGNVRSFNNEIYIIPDVIKEIQPSYLLVRKLELEKDNKKNITLKKHEIIAVKDSLLDLIKKAESSEGIDKDKLIMQLNYASPEIINQEIQKMIEEGIVFEPRPGKVRWLG